MRSKAKARRDAKCELGTERGRGAGGRRGRVAPLIPLALVVLGGIWLVRTLGASARGHGVAVVDTTRYRLHTSDAWLPDIWHGRLERVLAETGSLAALDRRALRSLQERIGELSFVAEVGSIKVLWPDGLSVPLRFRVPAACVRVRDEYLCISDDGVVLEGSFEAPPAAFGAWLPVLGPNEGELDVLLPGDVLPQGIYSDALGVALAMWNHLTPGDVSELGRFVIDASRSAGPDGLPGGVCLDLEGRRRILYGRASAEGSPGELPEGQKWRNVRSGLESLQGGADWILLDVRWDVPEVFDRAGVEGGPWPAGERGAVQALPAGTDRGGVAPDETADGDGR